MQVALKRVPIRRDMAETLLVDVGEHEIPVLVAVHGESAVQSELIVEADEVRSIEDPRSEYERLANLYGRDPESGRAYVDLAYTGFRQFLADLQQFAGLPAKRSKAAA